MKLYSFKKQNCVTGVVALMALGFISTGYAADKAYSDSSLSEHTEGYYMELNAGANAAKFNAVGQTKSAWDAPGLNISGGYQFSPFIGLEAGYSRYFVGPGVNALHMAVKGTLPITPDLNVFGKIGPGYVFKSGESVTLLFLGLGAGYRLMDNLELTTQILGQSFAAGNVGMLTVGFTYHF